MRARLFLKIALPAAAAALVLGAVSWSVARRSPQPREVELPPASVPGDAPQAPAEVRPSEDEPGLSFFAIGDTGYGGKTLAAVAASMDASAQERPVAFALLLGDNFYEFGVKSLSDERWRTCFEDAFAGPGLEIPFYAVLGNHDHFGNPDVQIEYASRSTRWRMPARWYTFTEPMPGGISAQFFALDTEPIEEEWASADTQKRWLAAELARSTARWKVVFGHHPALSHGRHGGTDELVAEFVPLFEIHGVDLYVSGHDHDLQLLRSGAGWVQLVSGAGSALRSVRKDEDTLFAASRNGYARVSFGARTLWIEMITLEGGVEFRWKATKR